MAAEAEAAGTTFREKGAGAGAAFDQRGCFGRLLKDKGNPGLGAGQIAAVTVATYVARTEETNQIKRRAGIPSLAVRELVAGIGAIAGVNRTVGTFGDVDALLLKSSDNRLLRQRDFAD